MVPPKVYGNLLQHLTGSKHHNVALREAAVRAGLKVSEYGIEEVETGEVLACEEEAEVYERLGLEWIPPELRENRGEIEAARKGKLPDLLEVGQIRGDLHTHTDWSDGKATLEQMVAAARARGYGYMPAVVGAVFGAWLHQRVTTRAVTLAFAGFLLLTAVKLAV